MTTLECTTELREITAVERRARRLRSSSLARLAVVRRDAMWAAIAALVRRGNEARFDEAVAPATVHVARLLRGTTVLQSWIARVRATATSGAKMLPRSGRRTDASRAHLESIQRALQSRHHDVAREMAPATQCVSADTAVELRELAHCHG